MIFRKIEKSGKLPCFCVSTDTGQYKLNGLVHHNSVLQQNIILHALEHWNNMSLVLIDPKLVEYSHYDGHKGVCAVANSPKEICEVLRLCRLVMHSRNKKLQQLQLKNIHEYKPSEHTGKVFITGREYNENDMIKCRIDGEEKQMTASELVELCKKVGVE